MSSIIGRGRIMKRYIMIAFLVIVLSLICGCSSNEQEGNAGSNNDVQDDLLNYINVELPKIVDLESTVTDVYSSVTGDNYKDDETLYNALVDVIIDNSVDLIDAAEAITPKTKEVREVHEKYLAAINTQHSAFTTIVAAIESQDYDKVSSANEKLSESRKGIRDFLASLEELAENNGVEMGE